MPKHLSNRGDDKAWQAAVIHMRVLTGEMRVPDALDWKKPRTTPLYDWDAVLDKGRQSEAVVKDIVLSEAEQKRIYEAFDAVTEAYPRLSQPEVVSRVWPSERWAQVAQFVAKLRGLAATACWSLPLPARHLSRDPRAIAETGLDDQALAASGIELAEGVVDARILRIATRLVKANNDGHGARPYQEWFSDEVTRLSRLSLIHFRNVCDTIERFGGEGDSRDSVVEALEQSYGPLAAVLMSIRESLSAEVPKFLAVAHDTLEVGGSSALRLGLGLGGAALHDGVDRGGIKQVGAPGEFTTAGVTNTRMNTDIAAGVGAGTSVMPATAALSLSPADAAVVAATQYDRKDHFSQIDHSRFLTSIASLAEVGDHQEPLDFVTRALARDSAPETEPPEEGERGERWRVEFTAEQLTFMQSAVRTQQPPVHGAQVLLRDVLVCYSHVGEAMRLAYGNELTLRSSSVDVARHRALLDLVKDLRELWRDAGAVMLPVRQADLVALDGVRLRHTRLVRRAFHEGGLEAATIVLARLALVDELLLPAEERRLTCDVPGSALALYDLVEEALKNMSYGQPPIPDARRQRWLQCPHETLLSILGGEVRRQQMPRFTAVEVPFDPFLSCIEIPIQLREFRIALILMEILVSDRVSMLIYEGAAAMVGGRVASLKGFLNLMLRYGYFSAETAASASVRRQQEKNATADAEKKRKLGSPKCRTKPTVADEGHGEVTKGRERPTSQKFVTVCKRCLNCDMPNFPHVSIGDVIRRNAPPTPSQATEGSVDVAAASDTATSVPASTKKSTSMPPSRKSLTASLANSAGAAAPREISSRNGAEDVATSPCSDPGEDAIISWATSVVADILLLGKDQRGVYFRWLARLVLYGMEEGRRRPTFSCVVDDNSVGVMRDRVGQGAGDDDMGRRRLSFQAALSNAVPRLENMPLACPPMWLGPMCSPRGNAVHLAPAAWQTHTLCSTATAMPTVGGVSAGDDVQHPISKQISRTHSSRPVPGDVGSRSDQFSSKSPERKGTEEEWEEVDAIDHSLISDSVLSVLRLDIGLPSLVDSHGKTPPREEGNRIAAKLYGGCLDRLAKSGRSVAHKMKRSARISRIALGLRRLAVPEVDVLSLQRELNDSTTNSSGLLLASSSGAIAIDMLFQSHQLVQETSRRSRVASGSGVRSGGNAGDGVGGASPHAKGGQRQPVLPSPRTRSQSRLREILDVAQRSALHCYGRTGYDPSSHIVSVAVRLLEHTLWPDGGAVAISTHEDCASDISRQSADKSAIRDKKASTTSPLEPVELTTDVAPLILSRVAAETILQKLRSEEDRLAAAENGDVNINPSEGNTLERRAAASMVRVQSVEKRHSSSSSSTSDGDGVSESVPTSTGYRPRQQSPVIPPTRSIAPGPGSGVARCSSSGGSKRGQGRTTSGFRLSRMNTRARRGSASREAGAPLQDVVEKSWQERIDAASLERPSTTSGEPTRGTVAERVAAGGKSFAETLFEDVLRRDYDGNVSLDGGSRDLGCSTDWPPCVHGLLSSVGDRGNRLRNSVRTKGWRSGSVGGHLEGLGPGGGAFYAADARPSTTGSMGGSRSCGALAAKTRSLRSSSCGGLPRVMPVRPSDAAVAAGRVSSTDKGPLYMGQPWSLQRHSIQAV
eukprot:TRINITY_DN28273_c0_g1_i1.p1 TRINITY_DN28273_c0_g1~~TRINITY_DN28273_c0_g1_i1.p1  ORF type:complete len:1637 (+),score=243.41 TRINITY_DN28273_c0_g1_i1:249-5159(+)